MPLICQTYVENNNAYLIVCQVNVDVFAIPAAGKPISCIRAQGRRFGLSGLELQLRPNGSCLRYTGCAYRGQPAKEGSYRRGVSP